MSRKISNILVICALVVIFPLLVIGSAFAAYYSINSTVTVGIYTDYIANSVSASVVYNARANKEEFEISGSHAKVITLKANSTGYTFKGWFDGNASKYEEAVAAEEVKYFNTEKELNVKLADHENILAVYEIVPFTIEYIVGGETQTKQAKGSTPLKNATNAATAAGLGNADAGKKWAWVDEEGNVVTTAEGNVSVTLSQVDIVYTINVAGGEGIEYTGKAATVSYTGNASALYDIFDEENYNTTLSFKSFGSVKFNGTEYTTASDLFTAVKAEYTTADTTIDVTPVVDNTFDKVVSTVIRYRANDVAENLCNAIVYNKDEDETEGSEVENITNDIQDDATATVSSWLKIFSTKFYLDVEGTDEVTVYEIDITIGGAICRVKEFDKYTTINDVLEAVYKELAPRSKITKAETLTIAEVLVKLG